MKLPNTLVMFLVCLTGTSSAFQPVYRHSLPIMASRTISTTTTTTTPTSLLKAAVNFYEGTEREVGSMDEWSTAMGVQRVEGFQLTTEDGGRDWSVMTTQDLPQGSGVLFVPEGMILSSRRVQQELGPAVQEAVDHLGRLGANADLAQFYLFLKVLLEYEKGDASPWFPWLNSLPRLYLNAVSMTNFCDECLPPLVFSYARAERVKLDNFVAALQKVDILSPSTKENKELAKWAFNAVYTRSFGDDDKRIVPMGDMFNHGTETEVDMAYDEEGNCSVYTTRDVPAGSPLRMSYGDPTNPSHLFATYGFLDESSPATFCKITSIQPTEELRNLGYDFSRMLFYKDTGDVSEEVWDVMLYQVLAPNRNDQQAFYDAHMRGDVDTKNAIHQHYFAQTSQALKNHVDTFLGQLDELSGKAVGADPNEHPRLPLILAHNEFVKETFLTVKSRLDPMVAEAQQVVA